MSFIGVITNQKNEGYIQSMLADIFPTKNLQFICDKNIQNMRNIYFEVLLIDKMIKEKVSLKKVISHTKYIILNSDLNIGDKLLENLDLTVITYGFHNKSTISISSVEENNVIICLQRMIKNLQGEEIEPQEFEIIKPENMEINSLLGTIGIQLMYDKSRFKEILNPLKFTNFDKK